MGVGYQFSDRRAVDYELWSIDGSPLMFRGPRKLSDDSIDSWVFLGGAQTFGRFVQRPFPALISGRFEKDHLNLGFAGAGPEFFLKRNELLPLINRSSLCFLQIMSGRSVSTTLLQALGVGGVLRFKRGPLRGEKFVAATAYEKLLTEYGESALADQICEARENWIRAYQRLVQSIGVPIIGLWISTRAYEYSYSPRDAVAALGPYPQLVTQVEIQELQKLGLPVIGQPFAGPTSEIVADYTTGEPTCAFPADRYPNHPDWARCRNTYYPTQGMHDFVAEFISEYLTGTEGWRYTDALSTEERRPPH